ncbi:Hypothetical protein MVR_LOCUS125 [uncultured virus]|nr:Hypothetical protein MVR_LOCUS125 [uncultured virus]
MTDWLDNYNVRTADKFWIYDPAALFRNGNYYRIIPSSKMTTAQVFNSLTLLVVYVSIIYILFTRKWTCVLVPIIAVIAIIALYFLMESSVRRNTRQLVDERRDRIDDVKDRISDVGDNIRNRFDDARDAIEDRIQDYTGGGRSIPDYVRSTEGFKMDAYSDPNDIYNRGFAQRNFCGTAGQNGRLSDQSGFAHWLYATPETCKENPAMCQRYEDLRYNRYNPDIDDPVAM